VRNSKNKIIINHATQVMHSTAIAVGTWLSVRLSHAGIVSKRLNLS